VAYRNGTGVNHCGDNGDARKIGGTGECAARFSKAHPHQTQYSVTDGRVFVGTIEVIDGYYVALDADGSIVGR